jgi:hypothetical protein
VLLCAESTALSKLSVEVTLSTVTTFLPVASQRRCRDGDLSFFLSFAFVSLTHAAMFESTAKKNCPIYGEICLTVKTTRMQM